MASSDNASGVGEGEPSCVSQILRTCIGRCHGQLLLQFQQQRAKRTAATGAEEGQGGELAATTTNAAATGAEGESAEVMGEGSDQMSQAAAPGAVENQQHISTDKVIAFYSHAPGRKFREFSNFWKGETFDFTLPSFAQNEGFPMTIPCEFSEKAIMLVKAAMNKDQTRFQLIRAAADPDSTKVRAIFEKIQSDRSKTRLMRKRGRTEE